MSSLLLALFISLIMSAASQGILVAGFVGRLRRWQTKLVQDNDCPPATVILCLRGGDPFLSKCIDGIVMQDYPNFQVLFMVDSEYDPSLSILQSTLLQN